MYKKVIYLKEMLTAKLNYYDLDGNPGFAFRLVPHPDDLEKHMLVIFVFDFERYKKNTTAGNFSLPLFKKDWAKVAYLTPLPDTLWTSTGSESSFKKQPITATQMALNYAMLAEDFPVQ